MQGTTVPLDGCAPRSAALIACRLSPGLLLEWPVAVLTYMRQPFDFTGFLRRESLLAFAALNPSYKVGAGGTPSVPGLRRGRRFRGLLLRLA